MDSHSSESDQDHPALIQQWTQTLRSEIATYKRAKQWRIARWIILPLVFLTLWSVFEIKTGFWWFWIVFGTNAAVDANAASRRLLATTLTKSKDPRVVSVLAIAARDGDDDTRKVASKGLEDILPILKASDRQYISDEGMDALITLLKRGTFALQIAILKSLKQIGNARAVPIVREMAHAKTALGSGRPGSRQQWEALQEAAAESLPYLEERVREDTARMTLLRPTLATESDNSLLRPAQSAESDDQILLRPTND